MQPFLQVSRDTAEALREFSNEFRDALTLGDFETWAGENGLVHQTDALKTTFPIPIDAAGYSEFKGDMKYRALYERSLSMKAKQWQDGVKAPAVEIEQGDFIGWSEAPTHMAAEWSRLPNTMVMTMLESGSGLGPLLDFYRDADSNTASTRRLFATDHPFNIFNAAIGTFDNDQTTTVAEIRNGSFFDGLEEYFRSIKGPNGKPMGLKLAGGKFLVPPHRANLFKKALELDTVIRAVSSAGVVDAAASVVAAVNDQNLWKQTIGYTVTDESSQADVFYAIAAGKPGLYPWVVQQGTPEEFLHDKSSEMYKNSLNVAVSYVGKANVAAALPHRIVKITITA